MCHGYLINELLAAHLREGPYGGPLENRTRLVRNALARIREATGGGRLRALRQGPVGPHNERGAALAALAALPRLVPRRPPPLPPV